MGFLFPAIAVAVLFIILRQIERWLHQHIFKVGWLLTHNFQTTTVLYYTFFLPGVVLHEVTYWLMAGLLNVRADRAIQMPEQQDIGELRLNFIQLDRKAGRFKRAIISATPLTIGLLLIWWLATNALEINTFYTTVGAGTIDAFTEAIRQLTTQPDFWLWSYLIFTVSNTMFPTVRKDLRGWWIISGVVVVFVIILALIGVNQEVVDSTGAQISQFLNILIQVILLVIILDILATLGLGLIESLLERYGKYHATFQKGKMITMTQEEFEAHQAKQRKKSARTRRKPTAAPPSTIYKLPFPIPGAPGTEPVTQGASAILGISEGEKQSLPVSRQSTKPDLITTPSKKDDAKTEIADTNKTKPSSPSVALPSAHQALQEKSVPSTPEEVSKSDSKSPQESRKSDKSSVAKASTPPPKVAKSDTKESSDSAPIQEGKKDNQNKPKQGNGTLTKSTGRFGVQSFSSKETKDASQTRSQPKQKPRTPLQLSTPSSSRFAPRPFQPNSQRDQPQSEDKKQVNEETEEPEDEIIYEDVDDSP